MPIIYGGKAIIPAPLIRVRKEYQTTDDGTPVGSVFQITLLGSFVAFKGSPNSSGVFWTAGGYPPDEVLTSDQQLGAILKKQQALRTLFATPGQTLEVVGLDGNITMQCNPRVRDVDEQEGIWFNKADYSISLEADTLLINGVEDAGDVSTYKVSKASEEWNVEILDQNLQTYRLTHSLSAIGKRYYDATGTLVQAAWMNAKDFVLNRIGLGLKPARMMADGVLNQDSLQAFNYIRGQSVNELGGVFGVTETWVCYNPAGGPAAYEQYEINARTGLDGRTSVSAQGNITGLAAYDNNTQQLQSEWFANAKLKWAVVQPNIFTRAQSVSGFTLNPTPINSTTGNNPVSGAIQYSVEYDDRPIASSLIAGAKMVTISIDGENPADVFAEIGIPGKASGPILQGMSTKTKKTRTVSIEAQMGAATVLSSPAQPNTDALMLTFSPVTSAAVFVNPDRENFVPNSGRYTRTTTFNWV